MVFADVILPLPLDGYFTYSVPQEMVGKVSVGHRVIVPFGARRYYTAIIVSIHDTAPQGFAVKEIHSHLDSQPLVLENQLKLWKWISFYYLSPIGDVYNAAFPSRLKLESDTHIQLIATDAEVELRTLAEKKIIDYLKEVNDCKISDLEKHLKIKDALPFADSLLFKGAVNVSEDIIQKYVPKTIKVVRVNTSLADAETQIGKAPKQLELYHLLNEYLTEREIDEIPKAKILKKFPFGSNILKGLTDKGILLESDKDVSRIEPVEVASREPYPLNEFQQAAFQEITNCHKEKNVCLLHGVTSSGKTEIYIHLIGQQIKEKRQVLYLVPEIALTTQLTSRLQAVFGDKMGVYHSKINDNERAEIWQKMLSDSPFEVVIGARSSVFLPYQNLGLVIVDEEHETGYKQLDPSPRYHARDTAVVLAQLHQAKVLLGSATPSIETYFNAKTGKYGLATISQRYENMELPEISIENTKELRRKKKMKTLLTPVLIEDISNVLQNGEQVILFRNRRGFAPLLECKNCGWTPKCKQCDVSLTYHKYRDELKCHYCGRTYSPTKVCEPCNEESLEKLGMGTEMLEEETRKLFPEASVARLDSDTTSSKNAYETIIGNFEAGMIDILIGTQMLSKGLDFENVSVVGIISSDGLLNHPDFRSHERGFQLMMQAAGRAGRKYRRGRVIIQAGEPDLPVYRYVQDNDYESFFHLQLNERKLFRYPPYTRLISILFKHRKESVVESGSRYFANSLRQSLGEMALGPNKPVVSYVQRYHIREILLKLDTKLSTAKVREFVKSVEKHFREVADYKYIVLHYDVDVV